MAVRTLEERLEIVLGIEKLLATGVKVDEACEQYGVSNPTYYTYRKRLVEAGMYQPTASTSEGEPGDDGSPPDDDEDEHTYEDMDAIVDALCDQADDVIADAVATVIDAWLPRIERLLGTENTASQMSGTLLDCFASDIQVAIGLAEDGE